MAGRACGLGPRWAEPESVQQVREQLVVRGLVIVDARATGRGRASTVTLAFADAGPWWDGEINDPAAPR